MTNTKPSYWQKDIDTLNDLRSKHTDELILKVIDESLNDLSRRYRTWIADETIRTVKMLERN